MPKSHQFNLKYIQTLSPDSLIPIIFILSHIKHNCTKCYGIPDLILVITRISLSNKPVNANNRFIHDLLLKKAYGKNSIYELCRVAKDLTNSGRLVINTNLKLNQSEIKLLASLVTLD